MSMGAMSIPYLSVHFFLDSYSAIGNLNLSPVFSVLSLQMDSSLGTVV